MLSSKLHSSIGNTDKLYVDDVFSAYTYTGNGSTQTINNGIDLAGKGGLVWIKRRDAVFGHFLIDTARGADYLLSPNATGMQSSGLSPYFEFTNTGPNIKAGGSNLNASGSSMTSWSFRKAPKFFDVVTYTGNGVAGRQIPHELGIAPGMVIVKATSQTSEWGAYHRSNGATKFLQLHSTAAVQTGSIMWGNTEPTDSVFTVDPGFTNINGATYVAYLFAHDTSADGIIQCGSYTGNGTYGAGPLISLNWEAQYLMVKRTDQAADWVTIDAMRGASTTQSNVLWQNLANAEYTSMLVGNPVANGFQITGSNASVNASGGAYIYLAIRRPNKPPTTGTEVYNAIARTGTGAAATVTGVGFAPDLVTSKSRAVTRYHSWIDRLRGVTQNLSTNVTDAEGSDLNSVTAFGVDGASLGTSLNFNGGGETYINHFFKRAPGFFDVVCYDGASSVQARKHNLNESPGFVIVKSRYSYDSNWFVYCSLLGADKLLRLESIADAQGLVGAWGGTANADVFYTSSVTSDAPFGKHVAYLFATLSGISKVGSYTGNGTTQTINCGFTTGARFILIKRTDSAGAWYVWDTARGIVSANDPRLSLNTAAAEVTTEDSVDPEASGFIVNQVAATNVNVAGATYIFLAVS